MNVRVEKFATGPIETNTYLVIDNAKECLVIDPSSGLDSLLSHISHEKFQPQAIVVTHGHFDHIMGIPEIIKHYPSLPVFIHPNERIMLTDPVRNMSVMLGKPFSFSGSIADLKEGEFTVGNFTGTVFVVPGHSPAGCALLIDKYLFCGDTLFAGSVGRTDFPGGDQDLLLDGIKKKLMVLDDETVVCPGHMGRSTIGRERRSNPFL